MISIRGLTKSYGAARVLDRLDLDVNSGSVTCIIGRSGSGKSTLLRCINRLEIPDAGHVMIDGGFLGYDLRQGRLYEVSEKVLARRRADIGLVFQSFNLFPHMTVIENIIEAPRVVRRLGTDQAVKEAEVLLDRVGLREKASAWPRDLSGGQQQRVAIARALAMKPKALLFDEPTSALDPLLVGEVLKVMRDLAENGTTMIVVTHEIEFARDVADQLVFMGDGRILEQGTPTDLLDNPQTSGLQRLLSRAP
jgi:polar amino acid transport system ATP-binding protein